VYQELWALLRPKENSSPVGLPGVIASLSPLTVSLRGEAVSQGLFVPASLSLCEDDLGQTVAVLPLEGGLLVLGTIREVGT